MDNTELTTLDEVDGDNIENDENLETEFKLSDKEKEQNDIDALDGAV